MPTTNAPACIYICQSGTCRSKGADAALVEIEELAKLVDDCTLEKTGCLGYCSQGPAVAVRTREQMRSKKKNNAIIHVRVNTFEKSVTVVQEAVGEEIELENLPPESKSRLSEIRAQKRREYFTSTYQWNKALSGLMTDPERDQKKLYSNYQSILSKAGYPNTNPLDLLKPRIRSRFQRMQIPTAIENYGPWKLQSVDVVSNHSAIFRFTTEDLKRGTPHPRGRGKMASPVTWHVTMLGEVGENEEGPLPWIERDYTPISSALEWERGTCDILIKIYNDGNLTSWLKEASKKQQSGHAPENERRIWLSKPIKTLSVPSLSLDEEVFRPASILLVLAGTGIVALPQILAHRDPNYKLGISTPRSAQLPCPIDLIFSCREDDILHLPQIRNYCIEWTKMQNPRKLKGLRNFTLLLTDKKEDGENIPPYYRDFNSENDESHNYDEILKDVPNAKVLKSQRLNEAIIANAIEKLKEPYRIIVSGPDTFNNAARIFLDSCEVDSTRVTMLSA